MNPRHLEARWRNAVQKFTKLRALKAEGNVLRNGAGRHVDTIEIQDTAITLIVEGHREYVWKNANDLRMELTIPIFNAQLRRWHYYPALAVRQAFTVAELMK